MNNSEISAAQTTKSLTSSFIGKVTLYFGLALLITAVAAICFPLLWQSLGYITLAVGTGEITSIAFAEPLLYILIASGVVLLIETFIFRLVIYRVNKTAGIIFYIIYALTMGLVLSFTCMCFDYYTLGISFGATAGTFIVLGLIGWFYKGNISPWFNVAFALVMSSMILIIVNIFIRSSGLYWLVSFGCMFAMVIYTIIDFNILKKAAESGASSDRDAIYFAFNLYYDFIYLFVRILQLVSYLKNSN